MINISEKKPALVNIGAISMYCEKMSMTSATALSVKPTVTGSTVKTNKCIQPVRAAFSGRIYNPDRPLIIAVLANNVNGSENVEIIYKNLRFVNCIITGYSVTDSNEDYLDLTVEASTTSMVYYLSEVIQ